MPCIGNIMKNVNINPREIVNFRKFAKMYTRENIYIHSSYVRIVSIQCIPHFCRPSEEVLGRRGFAAVRFPSTVRG